MTIFNILAKIVYKSNALFSVCRCAQCVLLKTNETLSQTTLWYLRSAGLWWRRPKQREAFSSRLISRKWPAAACRLATVALRLGGLSERTATAQRVSFLYAGSHEKKKKIKRTLSLHSVTWCWAHATQKHTDSITLPGAPYWPHRGTKCDHGRRVVRVFARSPDAARCSCASAYAHA